MTIRVNNVNPELGLNTPISLMGYFKLAKGVGHAQFPIGNSYGFHIGFLDYDTSSGYFSFWETEGLPNILLHGKNTKWLLEIALTAIQNAKLMGRK